MGRADHYRYLAPLKVAVKLLNVVYNKAVLLFCCFHALRLLDYLFDLSFVSSFIFSLLFIYICFFVCSPYFQKSKQLTHQLHACSDFENEQQVLKRKLELVTNQVCCEWDSWLWSTMHAMLNSIINFIARITNIFY